VRHLYNYEKNNQAALRNSVFADMATIALFSVGMATGIQCRQFTLAMIYE
jgi:hypothetical protein